MANNDTAKTKKIQEIPVPKTSIFSGGPSRFGGSSFLNQKGTAPKSFIPPPVRVTQNKGSGGK